MNLTKYKKGSRLFYQSEEFQIHGHNRSAICNMICTSVFCLNFIFAPEQCRNRELRAAVWLIRNSQSQSSPVLTRGANNYCERWTVLKSKPLL